jgi:hypothetical protein
VAGFRTIRSVLSIIAIGFCTSANSGSGDQIVLPAVEKMPNRPSPYRLRDWKQVARDFDALAFDEDADGEYLPLIWFDTSDTNYPFAGFGLFSGVGHFYQGSGIAREAITCIPAVVGASLVGIDKSDQNGRNWVTMCQKFFNRDNSYPRYRTR